VYNYPTSAEYVLIPDRWSIVRPLGGDRRSRVFEIRRDSSGVCEKCALKVIRLTDEHGARALLTPDELEAYSEKLEKLMRSAIGEVRTLIELKDCPNIMRYYDCSAVEWESDSGFGCDFMIRTELLEPLTSVQRKRTFTREKLIAIGEELAQALEYCHSHGVIHRDIKPGNIFFDSSGRCKLGDFGIAAVSDSSRNRASTAIGTPTYASPEEFLAITSAGYDHRVDIYSLGLVLYELANGNKPPVYSPGDGFEANLRKRLAGKRLPKLQNTDAALRRVIEKACSFKPSGRYRSASEMLAALRHAETTTLGIGRAAVPIVAIALCAAFLIAVGVIRKAQQMPRGEKQGYAAMRLTEAPITAPLPSDAPMPVEKFRTPALSETPLSLPDSFVIGDHLTIGRFDCDGNAQNGLEPLEWIVYAVSGGRTMLICRNTLRCFEITAGELERGYRSSHIREWLTGEFYRSAFSDEERPLIGSRADSADADSDLVTLPDLSMLDSFLNAMQMRSTSFLQPVDFCVEEAGIAVGAGDVYLVALDSSGESFEFASFYPYNSLSPFGFGEKGYRTDGGS
jgi:hypothetical protein